jgi:glyceraldehyde 3-phosphate dehydrogenase
MSYESNDIEVVAINDLGNLENLAYLLEYDTVYGRAPYSVQVVDGALIVGGRTINFSSIREPKELTWGAQDIDVVVESTGVFTSYEKAKVHLRSVSSSRHP